MTASVPPFSPRRLVVRSRAAVGSIELRRVLALTVLAVAGGATLATSGSVPSTESYLSRDITLTADRPVAVRTVVATVDPAGRTFEDVRLELDVFDPQINPSQSAPLDPVWISLLDPAAPATSLRSDGTLPSNASIDLHAACGAQRCTRTYVLVARLLDPQAHPSLAFHLNGALRAYGPASTAGGHASLTVDDERSFTGAPQALVARTQADADLSAGGPLPTTHLELRIPATDLHDLAWPVSGRLYASAETASSTPDTWLDVTVRTPSSEQVSPWAVDAEWLSACVPDRDCVVPIEVRPGIMPGRYDRTAAPGARASGSWSLEVRLELLAPAGTLSAAPLTLGAPVGP